MIKWFKTHQRDVNQCIIQNSEETIPANGKLVVRLVLKDKKLRYIKKVWSTFEPSVDECVMTEMQKWAPSTKINGDVPQLSVPFEFIK